MKLIKLRINQERMLSARQCYEVFRRSIADYHRTDDVDTPVKNPNASGTFEALLYAKNWIDTVQWHLEDIIRLPEINPVEAVALKRRIDKSNQDRTDMVEQIDDQFVAEFGGVTPQPGARINSETPAWLLDRMSILMLKIYHMREQTERTDASADHIARCQTKLAVLLEQENDMALAFDELIEDIGRGTRRFKVYRQMKMYNDASLNPVLYAQKK
ncbi:DUF4254 domain-containing protein [Parachryseolinea silvisoli]|jgi:hypothetical protein|uniref:DUF4254 domain-containing protein n=1 Tax=Parachryseolinea silvisoli TaxID=2873601 RepID=UPI002265AAD7|nr:DUF4254 domain-containing protein [Parachryseolinea silvisoli]